MSLSAELARFPVNPSNPQRFGLRNAESELHASEASFAKHPAAGLRESAGLSAKYGPGTRERARMWERRASGRL